MSKKNPAEATLLADRIIKHTYRTLFTRGMKSCMAYFVFEETSEYFRSGISSPP